MKIVNEKASEPTTAVREYFPNEDKTKYTIYANGEEKYEVSFKYFTDNDSIEVAFINKLTLATGRKSVKFNRRSGSHYIIRNYSPNDSTVTAMEHENLNQILFSVPNPATSEIYLNQFRAIDDEVYFTVQALVPAILKQHLDLTADYWRMYIQDSVNEQRRLANVALVKKRMVDYSDSMVKSIINRATNKRQAIPNTTADKNLSDAFILRMDTLFTRIFKSEFAYENIVNDVNIEMPVNGEGILFVAQVKTSSKNGESTEWLQRIVASKIIPVLQQMRFATPVENDNYPNLMEDLLAVFRTDMKKYPPKTPGFDEFVETRTAILNAYEPYMVNRRIQVPVKYNYPFKIEVKQRKATWKVILNENGIFDFDDKSDQKEFIPDDLKQIFLDKMYYDRKSRKYEINICTVTITNNAGSTTTKDIQLISKK